MIKIKKGNHSLLVSKKTYETMFKPIGYIVEEEAPKKASKKAKKETIDVPVMEKTTLGDIEGLAALKEQLSNDEKKKSKK